MMTQIWSPLVIGKTDLNRFYWQKFKFISALINLKEKWLIWSIPFFLVFCNCAWCHDPRLNSHPHPPTQILCSQSCNHCQCHERLQTWSYCVCFTVELPVLLWMIIIKILRTNHEQSCCPIVVFKLLVWLLGFSSDPSAWKNGKQNYSVCNKQDLHRGLPSFCIWWCWQH